MSRWTRSNWNNRLKPYVEAGYVNAQRHPKLPITLYDYTDACTFDQQWDEVTTQSRGLLVDDRGRKVNRPLPKFFNKEEPQGEAVVQRNRGVPFYVSEKLDGSCIFVTRYIQKPSLKDRLVHGTKTTSHVLIHTRGSFFSKQAQDAQMWLETYHGFDWIQEGYTYIFEWIAPENRIVVNYGDRRELVLLARMNHDNDYCRFWCPEWKGRHAKYFLAPLHANAAYLSYLKRVIGDNEEGYIVTYLTGDRVKVKGEEYLRRHRIYNRLSTYSVWEAMQDTFLWDDFIAALDEESRMWAEAQCMEMMDRMTVINRRARRIAERSHKLGVPDKDFAEAVHRHVSNPAIRAVVFAHRHGNALKAFDYLWQVVKPENKLERFSHGLSH